MTITLVAIAASGVGFIAGVGTTHLMLRRMFRDRVELQWAVDRALEVAAARDEADR